MASLFRPVIVRWLDAAGRRVAAGTPGARKVRTRSRKWYGKGIPGQVRPVPLATDRTAAQRMLAEMVRDFERGAAGIVPVEVRERTLAEWIDLYRDEVLADGSTVKHARRKHTHLSRMCAGLGWTHPRDLAAGPLKLWLAELIGAGFAPQTRNHYLSAMREFCWWLIRRDALAKNPFREIKLLNVEADQRHARRSLTVEELGRLLEVARTSDRTVYRLDGEARYHLYLLACSSGFRAGELHSLTPAHFRLQGDQPALILPARTDKAGRPVTQPLPPDVAAAFRLYLESRPRVKQVWPGSWTANAAFMLRHDLRAADIEPVVDSPETGPLHCDFHALRHTYVSLLEAAGISLKQAMELARHRNPALTLKRYGRVRLEELADAVRTLPVPGVAPTVAGENLHPLERLLCLLAVVLGLDLVAPVVAPGEAPARGELSIREQRRREREGVASHRRRAG